MTMVNTFEFLQSVAQLTDASQLNSVLSSSFFNGYPAIPPTELLDSSADLYRTVIF